MILDAFAAGGATASARVAFFDTRDRDSVLGRYSHRRQRRSDDGALRALRRLARGRLRFDRAVTVP